MTSVSADHHGAAGLLPHPLRTPYSALSPTAPKGKWSHAYLMREVRGEGLGREPREDASGVSSHCSSCCISSSSVRPPAGGQGRRVRAKGQVQGLRSG